MNNKFGLLTDESSYEKSFSRLDEFQRAAASSENSNVVIRASAGSGKALKNGTNVLTIQGWKPIESLTTNDKVAAEDGTFYSVLGIYPQGLKQIYKITFSDKNVIECSGDHIWTWQSSENRNRHKDHWTNSSTEELSNKTLQLNNGHWDIYLPQPDIIDFPEKAIPLNPYLLGALLGDGNMSDKGLIFTVAEDDLKEKIQNILAEYNCSLNYISRYDYSIQGPLGFGYHNTQNYIGASLRELGLTYHNSHNKFIPDIYKYNSEAIRLRVLQGIIDTDGYCDGSAYDITLASKQLILDIQFICESLGFTATYSEKTSYCNGKNSGIVYRLRIKTSKKYPKIHTTKNKDSRWKQGQSSARRTIRSIEKTNEFAEMTCIEVASPNHLYLTEHMIPTHNTSTLIAAISAYRYNNLNDRICAITYTRAARAEMEARLQELGVNDVDVTTIHVWARNRLNDLSIKYDFKIQILEEPQIRTILQEIIPAYLATARVKNVNLDILYTYIMGSKRINITENYRRTLNALELRYINYKRENNLYDFTDYPLYLYNVLTAYNETIQDIDALFVDEFQDVDETQLKIFDLVKAKKKFYIGDKWQSIYTFRGACGEVFEKLDGFQLYKLKCNYRSYQEIIDYATTVYMELLEKTQEEQDCYISEIMFSHDSHIKCARGSGGEVYIINPFGRVAQFSNHRTSLKAFDLFNRFMKLQPMILCRTNKQVKYVQSLGYFNVDTVHQAKGLEYKNVITLDSTINSLEDLNVAYVSMTRAEDGLLVINWQQFESWFKLFMNKVNQEVLNNGIN